MILLFKFKILCVFLFICWVAAEERENPFSHVVKHTLITTARNCMSHVNATEKDLEHLREEPPYPEKSACIIKCLLEKVNYPGSTLVPEIKEWNSLPADVFPEQYNLGIFKARLNRHLLAHSEIGVVKNNKYSKMGFLTAVTPLVFAHKKKLEHMKKVGENCDSEINHHEVQPCQLGNEVITCIFKYAPELHLKA